MPPHRIAVALTLLLACALPAEARQGGPGPQKPIWPKPGQTDAMLYEKAVKLQAPMWWHLSPEGLLIVSHRRGATPADLSHDALFRSDAAMWTGCYAASQVCRWMVTRDPDALEQVRHLARGLTAISTVTGVPGAFGRNVGRPQTPNAGEKTIASPTGSGLRFRPDASRDQLAGVTLGWYFIGKYMDDPELKALAAQQMRAIAFRLWTSKMWLRDHLGNKTRYGELRVDVKYAPLVKNGGFAAIGLATMVAAADLNPQDVQLPQVLASLHRKGWDDALPQQHTFLPSIVNASNVNMFSLPLLVLALSPQWNWKFAHKAKKGMRALRKATVGWWNAGICACWLHGGIQERRQELRGEVRATLHGMPDREVPRILVHHYHGDTVAPIWQRQPGWWHWTNDVRFFHIWKPGGELPPVVYWTGADWLFAYWLARAAGELQPRVGPGADPKAHHIPMDLPPWRRTGEAPEAR